MSLSTSDFLSDLLRFKGATAEQSTLAGVLRSWTPLLTALCADTGQSKVAHTLNDCLFRTVATLRMQQTGSLDTSLDAALTTYAPIHFMFSSSLSSDMLVPSLANWPLTRSPQLSNAATWTV